MYAEDLRRHNSSNGETVEDIYKRLPRLDITPPLAFIIEPIYYPKRVRTTRLRWMTKHHLVLHWHTRDFLVRGKNSRDI